MKKAGKHTGVVGQQTDIMKPLPVARISAGSQSGLGAAWKRCVVLCGVVLFLSPQATFAREPQKAPETVDPAASCVSTECHVKVKKSPNLHWPVSADVCAACHEQEEDKHEFTVADSMSLCQTCHGSFVEEMLAQENVHIAVQIDCLMCHDPHGSEAESLLLAENQKEICFKCHGGELLGGQFKHFPAEQGMCTVCHNPHSSPHSRLLRAEKVSEVCGMCHVDVVEVATQAAKYKHFPAEQGMCAICHNPHSSPHSRMLQAEKVSEVCGVCHGTVVELAEQAEVDHAPVLAENGCVNCHSPHGADAAPLLKQPSLDLCLGCHDRPLVSGSSRLLDIKGWLEDNSEWHQPIREKSCPGCHQPHGSENFRLLKKPFPASFYSSFSRDNYSLCFTCHEAAAFLQPRTRAGTGFRDGNRNLHFLHVNRRKGRTCRACHELHASREPLHIRDRTPFGGWMMPINFQKLGTGGSCEPGCHPTVTYDRKRGDYREEK